MQRVLLALLLATLLVLVPGSRYKRGSDTVESQIDLNDGGAHPHAAVSFEGATPLSQRRGVIADHGVENDPVAAPGRRLVTCAAGLIVSGSTCAGWYVNIALVPCSCRTRRQTSTLVAVY